MVLTYRSGPGLLILLAIFLFTMDNSLAGQTEPDIHRVNQGLGGELVGNQVNTGFSCPLPHFEPKSDKDYDALSAQIQQLSQLIHAMQDSEPKPTISPASNPLLTPLSISSVPPETVAAGATAMSRLTATYGPGGVTVDSVSLVLDYRLLLTGNPHLRAGDIRDGAADIHATVVTANGSKVEEFRIDKTSGEWFPVR